MPTAVDIGRAGEEAANAALQKSGWKTDWDTKAPGSTDIEASAGNKKLLVQVKTAVSPSSPVSLSSIEEQNIRSRAARIGANAYEARVTLQPDLSPLSISWRQLA